MAASKSTFDKQSKGRLAEDLALQYLVQIGWTVISRREEIAGVEVDIIAESPDGILSVIEVKSAQVQYNNYSINWRQKKRLFRAANALTSAHYNRSGEVQVILAQVDLKRSKVQLEFDLW